MKRTKIEWIRRRGIVMTAYRYVDGVWSLQPSRWTEKRGRMEPVERLHVPHVFETSKPPTLQGKSHLRKRFGVKLAETARPVAFTYTTKNIAQPYLLFDMVDMVAMVSKSPTARRLAAAERCEQERTWIAEHRAIAAFLRGMGEESSPSPFQREGDKTEVANVEEC